MSKKIKGYLCLFFLVAAIIGGIQSCTHEHEWVAATCTEPKACSSCNETEGEPLGHDYQGGNCISPGVCVRCGERDPGYYPHKWVDATCTEAEHCEVCGKDRHWYSTRLGHEWVDATCTAPKTCSRCGATEGEPQHDLLDHYWETTIDPTCQSPGEESQSCRLCGVVETRTVPSIDHKAGDWQIIQEATASAPGIKVKTCTMCGTEMDRTEYTLPPPEMSAGTGGSTAGGGGARGGSGRGNGSNFNIYDNANQQNTTASYVLNTSTMRFHRPSCRDVRKIASQNYATSSRSRDDLISSGYKPCGHCSP